MAELPGQIHSISVPTDDPRAAVPVGPHNRSLERGVRILPAAD